jgi:exosome complex exonuclease RRP6
MLLYARSDTHFLLYIYDNLRNALLDRALSRAQSPLPSSTAPSPSNSNLPDPSHALIKEVMSRSEETALRTYEKEGYDAEGGTGNGGWDALLKKWNREALLVEGTQRRVFLSVHAWRDRIAREEDENTRSVPIHDASLPADPSLNRYVFPNHYLLRLAEHPPTDIAALISVFRPIPPVIRRRAKELFEVIRESVSLGQPIIPKNPLPKAESLPAEGGSDTNVNTPLLWPNGKFHIPCVAAILRVFISLHIVSQIGNAVVSSSSSLFGSTLVATPLKKHNPYSTAKSSLFGNPKETLSPAVSDCALYLDFWHLSYM